MNFKIHKSPGSRCIIIKSSLNVYKVAFSLGSVKQLRYEFFCNKTAQLDEYWAKHVVSLVSPIDGVLRSKLLAHQASLKHEALIDFINKRYSWSLKQPRMIFYNVVQLNGLYKFIFPNISPSLFIRIENFIKSFKVEVGSVHGDLHIENIFIKNQNISIIDWGNYKPKYWCKYDLYHLIFCDYKENISWIDKITNFYNEYSKKNYLNNFQLSNEDLICYVLSRCELEILQDVRLNRLKKSRIKKYKRAIEILEKLI